MKRSKGIENVQSILEKKPTAMYIKIIGYYNVMYHAVTMNNGG